VQPREFSNFDAEYCRRAVAISALTSALLFAAEIAIMIFVRSEVTQCPGWAIQSRNGSNTSLWLLVAVFGGAGVFASCLQYLLWDRLAARIRSDIMAGEVKPSAFVPPTLTVPLDPRSFPFNKLITAVSVGWPLLCTGMPLREMLVSCTTLSTYFP
jgi:hypothetical protein